MMEQIFDTLTALRHQEDSGYTARNFLHQDDPAVSVCTGPLNVDAECRSKMVGWCFQIADYCKFQRETVEIAINYLDRFLATVEGSKAKYDPQLYQLAAMTSLYMAVKIHEPQAMDLKTVARLSRDAYTPEDIQAMEQSILFALQWKLNPPTALTFVRLLLEAIPEGVLPEDVRPAIYDVTKYQAELAVNESELITVKASVIAYCALLNSLESLSVDDKAAARIEYALARSVGIDSVSQRDVDEVKSWLFKAVIQQSSHDFSLAQQPCTHDQTIKSYNGSLGSDTATSPRSIYSVR